ncbi:MAG: hypothetical protein LBS74_09345 [Oscillospiraceae bacterium]|jgi:hypothetical protein|nr:hypothetical protein [Oscillospiraceae bacterium]
MKKLVLFLALALLVLGAGCGKKGDSASSQLYMSRTQASDADAEVSKEVTDFLKTDLAELSQAKSISVKSYPPVYMAIAQLADSTNAYACVKESDGVQLLSSFTLQNKDIVREIVNCEQPDENTIIIRTNVLDFDYVTSENSIPMAKPETYTFVKNDGKWLSDGHERI